VRGHAGGGNAELILNVDDHQKAHISCTPPPASASPDKTLISGGMASTEPSALDFVITLPAQGQVAAKDFTLSQPFITGGGQVKIARLPGK